MRYKLTKRNTLKTRRAENMVQGFRVQRFRVQGFRGSRVQGFKGSGFR